MAFKLEDYTVGKVNKRIGAGQGASITQTLGGYVGAINDLKKALDSGKIGVAEYLEYGKKLATTVDQAYNAMAGQGSRAASEANSVGLYQHLAEAGFSLDNTKAINAGDRFNVDLGEKYEEKLRQELLPENLTPEERERYLKDIPTDIGFDTDRFTSEREGLRQQIQQEQAANQAKTIRQQRLDELSKLLTAQTSRQFQLDTTPIATEAQSQGFLETSGFGDRLAKRHAELDERSQDILSAQALSDRDYDINAINNALATRQSFQTAGVQRDFSLDDRARSLQDAIMMANLTKPAGPDGSKTTTDKIQNSAALVTSIASLASAAKGK